MTLLIQSINYIPRFIEISKSVYIFVCIWKYKVVNIGTFDILLNITTDKSLSYLYASFNFIVCPHVTSKHLCIKKT